MNRTINNRGMGWLPDLPDFRDYSAGHKTVAPMLQKTSAAVPRKAGLPAAADLRPWCSPIVDQGKLGSCTANAAAGLVEYFENKAFGNYLNASRLFLYKVERDLLQMTGDTGAYLRTAMQALVMFGVPPEPYWPYDVSTFDNEPPAFCYSFARNYQTISYYSLDPAGSSPNDILSRIKTNLTSAIPAMFGFTVYNSIQQAATTGEIPLPTSGDTVAGGHAIGAVGYDDNKQITNSNPGGQTTTGALLIRNSWGTSWGMQGYGWMPYEYVLQGIAIDWWTMLNMNWVDTGQFRVQ